MVINAINENYFDDYHHKSSRTSSLVTSNLLKVLTFSFLYQMER